MVAETKLTTLNAACVIHGSYYDWNYVDKLRNMLQRHCSLPVTMHVYTEAHRPVPEPFVKHILEDWNLSGRQAWWYKIQLFNAQHYQGPLLYLDLDTVIIDNIDWIWQLDSQKFWIIRDFSYLYKPHTRTLNSSVMWWDTTKFADLYRCFKSQKLHTVVKSFQGDQNWITEHIPVNDYRVFDQDRVVSWRWQCVDGGYEFKTRTYTQPGTGTCPPKNASILVFHGNPKPDKIQDSFIVAHWK